MIAYQYPTYLLADASISAAPAELWRLVLAIPRGPSIADFGAEFFNLWVPNFFWFVGFLNVFSVQTQLCTRWTDWRIAEAPSMPVNAD